MPAARGGSFLSGRVGGERVREMQQEGPSEK